MAQGPAAGGEARLNLAEVRLWLKLALFFVFVPCWLWVLYCVVTGQNQTTAETVGVGAGAIITLLALIFARRKNGSIS